MNCAIETDDFTKFLNGKRKLLATSGNPKTDLSTGKGFLTMTLSLAPGNSSGFEVCFKRTIGCSSVCLGEHAGRGVMRPVRKARKEKTRFVMMRKEEALRLIRKELSAGVRKARRMGLEPACRLNVFSDLLWELTGIMQEFPEIQFYDYTAIASRFRPEWKLPENYHLTFSLKENNKQDALKVLALGGNVAVVFRKELPEFWNGFPVIDGLAHDLRFLDPKGCVVGLLAKGKAKKDQSGFVQDLPEFFSANRQSDSVAVHA